MNILNAAVETAYQLGVQAGIQQMEDKIQKNCSLGKPVMANGKLYFFQDSRKHLKDVMDSFGKEDDEFDSDLPQAPRIEFYKETFGGLENVTDEWYRKKK